MAASSIATGIDISMRKTSGELVSASIYVTDRVAAVSGNQMPDAQTSPMINQLLGQQSGQRKVAPAGKMEEIDPNGQNIPCQRSQLQPADHASYGNMPFSSTHRTKTP
jgi:hypothetical protein